jgi:hypothetical protein
LFVDLLVAGVVGTIYHASYLRRPFRDLLNLQPQYPHEFLFQALQFQLTRMLLAGAII